MVALDVYPEELHDITCPLPLHSHNTAVWHTAQVEIVPALVLLVEHFRATR